MGSTPILTTMYFNDIRHKTWQDHYIPSSWGGFALAFTKEWKEQYLPKNSTSDGFDIIQLDQQDGKHYKSKIYVAYDQIEDIILDEDYNVIKDEIYCLMNYFYGCHHCPCHRKTFAKLAGAIIDEDCECEGDRFLIYSITSIDNPELNLYSEVLTEFELEESLEQWLKNLNY